MKQHFVPKIGKTADLDFLTPIRIDHIQWPSLWDLSRFPESDVRKAAARFQAEARIGYDAEAFYVRLSANEAELRAAESGPLGAPCEDSCLEFFFSPDPAGKRYFNIEMNPNACFYFGIGTSIETLVRLRPELDPDPFSAITEIDGNAWSITYRVPLALIRMFFPDFALRSGVRLRANFFHCGDSTVLPHFLSWNPVEGERVSYHQPEYFGELILE